MFLYAHEGPSLSVYLKLEGRIWYHPCLVCPTFDEEQPQRGGEFTLPLEVLQKVV